MRKLLDEYLDGVMDAPERAKLEQRLANDPGLARLLARMRSERALRVAAMASIEPSAAEASQAANRVLEAIERPATVGYVGVWLKRLGAVAAVLAIAAGSFVIGRNSVSQPSTPTQANAPETLHKVLYISDAGDLAVREFREEEDALQFIHQQEVRRASTGVADGGALALDLSRPGEL